MAPRIPLKPTFGLMALSLLLLLVFSLLASSWGGAAGYQQLLVKAHLAPGEEGDGEATSEQRREGVHKQLIAGGTPEARWQLAIRSHSSLLLWRQSGQEAELIEAMEQVLVEEETDGLKKRIEAQQATYLYQRGELVARQLVFFLPFPWHGECCLSGYAAQGRFQIGQGLQRGSLEEASLALHGQAPAQEVRADKGPLWKRSRRVSCLVRPGEL